MREALWCLCIGVVIEIPLMTALITLGFREPSVANFDWIDRIKVAIGLVFIAMMIFLGSIAIVEAPKHLLATP